MTSRDAALGALAGLRDRVYRALACRARPYSANALSTVVHDVDAVQDLFVRCVVPFAGAVLVSAASTAVVWWLSPPAGPVLACGLLVGLVVVPSVAGLRSRRSDRLVAADRAALTTRVVHLFRGAAELAVSGTGAAARHDVATAADRLADRQRSAPALGATSAVLLTAGVTAACALAADDTTGGRITAIVLTLVVLAAFDVCVPLPAVARQLARIAGAVRRIWPTRRYSCWTNSPRAWTPRRPMPCSPTSSRPPRGTPSYW